MMEIAVLWKSGDTDNWYTIITDETQYQKGI